MKSFSIPFFVLLLACIGIWGCEASPEIVGLWEFDQVATDKENSNSKFKDPFRIEFSKDGSARSQHQDGTYTISIWKIKEEITSNKNVDHPAIILKALKESDVIYEIEAFKVFEGLSYMSGFSHWKTYAKAYAYLKKNGQLVLYYEEAGAFDVFSRIE